MQKLALLLTIGALAVATSVGSAQGQDVKADAPLPHAFGQSVTPSFEGWYANPDGTCSLVFGYFNRNHEEHLDIPVGPNNKIEPGPADQGQPTHFLPRRQTGVFAIVVPADFGDRQVAWTLTSHGETITIPGHMRSEWEITALEEVTSGNTPPIVRFGPDGKAGQGPLGTRSTLTASAGIPIDVTVWVTDDGVRRSGGAGAQMPWQPPPLGVEWTKYRGTGDVRFSEQRPTIDESGQAVTSVTFSEAGEYVLRILAFDTSGGQGVIMAGGFFCCWTNGYVSVRVQ